MSKKKEKEQITYNKACDKYFGGLLKLSKSSLPWHCKCGMGVLSLPECWRHLKVSHEVKFI